MFGVCLVVCFDGFVIDVLRWVVFFCFTAGGRCVSGLCFDLLACFAILGLDWLWFVACTCCSWGFPDLYVCFGVLYLST